MYLHRTMLVPDSIVEIARALAESFGPASANMWTTPLSPTGQLPATHWISTGFVGDDFASALPLSRFVDGVWTTDAYDPAAFISLCAVYGLAAPSVEQLTGIMGMVDVSDQPPSEAMNRMGLVLVQDGLEP